MPDINYLSSKDLDYILFNIVEEYANSDEPLPDYSRERDGSLESVLEFMQNDEYYDSFEIKTAYMFVSIIKNHFFSNGNKRLAFVTVLYFLFLNGKDLKQGVSEKLKNLGIKIADSEQNDDASFKDLIQQTAEFFEQNLVEIN